MKKVFLAGKKGKRTESLTPWRKCRNFQGENGLGREGGLAFVRIEKGKNSKIKEKHLHSGAWEKGDL